MYRHTPPPESAQVADLGVDMLTLVGHKFGAPKGVAALFVRRGLELPPMVHGGGQEAGRRAGTENVLLISGMGKAAEVRGRRRHLCCTGIDTLAFGVASATQF